MDWSDYIFGKIYIDREGKIVDGHHRVMTAIAKGAAIPDSMVEVLGGDSPDDAIEKFREALAIRRRANLEIK